MQHHLRGVACSSSPRGSTGTMWESAGRSQRVTACPAMGRKCRRTMPFPSSMTCLDPWPWQAVRTRVISSAFGRPSEDAWDSSPQELRREPRSSALTTRCLKPFMTTLAVSRRQAIAIAEVLPKEDLGWSTQVTPLWGWHWSCEPNRRLIVRSRYDVPEQTRRYRGPIRSFFLLNLLSCAARSGNWVEEV